MTGFKNILVSISLLFMGCVEGPQRPFEPTAPQSPPEEIYEEGKDVSLETSSGPSLDTVDATEGKPDSKVTGEDAKEQTPVLADAQ